MARRRATPPDKLSQPWDRDRHWQLPTLPMSRCGGGSPHRELDDWVVLNPWNTAFLCFPEMLLISTGVALASQRSLALTCTEYMHQVLRTRTRISAAQREPSSQCDATRYQVASPLPLTQLCSKIKIVECCVIRYNHAKQFPGDTRDSNRFKMLVGSGYTMRGSRWLQLSLLPDHWVTSLSRWQGPSSRLAPLLKYRRLTVRSTRPVPSGPTRPCRRWRALAAGETGAALPCPLSESRPGQPCDMAR
jgi:hypothetical protein